jgi:hypothetical protein
MISKRDNIKLSNESLQEEFDSACESFDLRDNLHPLSHILVGL